MKELSITVSTAGDEPRRYRFAEFPVRIGRAPTSHLAICHEAVSRELCLAWLEEGGQSVRVEEQPDLTNPLLLRNHAVCGGVSGPSLLLCVGPVVLKFEAGESALKAEKKKSTTGRAVIGLLTIAIAAGWLQLNFATKDENSSSWASLAQLPSSPLCAPPIESCQGTATCAERARLLVSRALEKSARTTAEPASLVRSILLLRKTQQLGLGALEYTPAQIKAIADEWEERVLQAYRKDVLRLRQLLATKNAQVAEIRQAAERVSRYLAPCYPTEQNHLLAIGRGGKPNGD